jgi:hypothetical protein
MVDGGELRGWGLERVSCSVFRDFGTGGFGVVGGVFGLDPVELVGEEVFGEGGVVVQFEGGEEGGHGDSWVDGLLDWWIGGGGGCGMLVT